MGRKSQSPRTTHHVGATGLFLWIVLVSLRNHYHFLVLQFIRSDSVMCLCFVAETDKLYLPHSKSPIALGTIVQSMVESPAPAGSTDTFDTKLLPLDTFLRSSTRN